MREAATMSDHNLQGGPDNGTGMHRLADLIKEETDSLMNELPAALDRQWSASPVPKPREDTQQRASGGKSDPTFDIVADPRRLAVRRTVASAEIALRDALITLRASRVAMARAVARYDGGGLP
ncbi:DUF7169 domain-containing protein [Kribbella sp. WER1]